MVAFGMETFPGTGCLSWLRDFRSRVGTGSARRSNRTQSADESIFGKVRAVCQGRTARIFLATGWAAREHSRVPHSDADRARYRLQADVALKKIDGHERIAVQAERAATDRVRANYARLYRKLVGVDPGLRGELRRCLEHVRAGGHRAVPDLIAELSRQTPNSSSGAG